MEWWKQYEEYIVSNEVHPITKEREDAINDPIAKESIKERYLNPEDFMSYYKDGRQVVFDFNGYKYSVIHFPDPKHMMLTFWHWEVYSLDTDDDVVGRAKNEKELNKILAECFRKAYIRGVH